MVEGRRRASRGADTHRGGWDMLRIVRAGVPALAVLVLWAGCGKKTMDQPPTITEPPKQTLAPPVEPPPPPPPVEAAPVALSLQDVYFDYDSSTLSDVSRSALTENGKMLVANPGRRVTIEGHCDERGTVDYNLALGERRAGAAKEFLVSYGVDGTTLETISYGENRPFSMGHDESAWRSNRRAHFVTTP
jgi:peptidoglycan-associated lipoprotein